MTMDSFDKDIAIYNEKVRATRVRDLATDPFVRALATGVYRRLLDGTAPTLTERLFFDVNGADTVETLCLLTRLGADHGS